MTRHFPDDAAELKKVERDEIISSIDAWKSQKKRTMNERQCLVLTITREGSSREGKFRGAPHVTSHFLAFILTSPPEFVRENHQNDRAFILLFLFGSGSGIPVYLSMACWVVGSREEEISNNITKNCKT